MRMSTELHAGDGDEAIEITPEMIAAGVRSIWPEANPAPAPQLVVDQVVEIFRAMYSAHVRAMRRAS
jgi:hypothetical protein